MNDTLSIFLRTNPALFEAVKNLPPKGIGVGDSAVLTTSGLFADAPVDIAPVLIYENHFQVFLLVILFFGLILALLRWYMPDRLLYEFDGGERLGFARKKSSILVAPSLAIDFFFLVNYQFSISLLTYIFVVDYLSYILSFLQGYTLFFLIAGAYVLFWVYRRVAITFLAYIFLTTDLSQQQLRLDKGIQQLAGLLALPLLMLALLADSEIFLPMALIAVIGLQVFRWGQTITIGIRNTRFSAFHFILYLCALEIVPLIIVVKLLLPENYL